MDLTTIVILKRDAMKRFHYLSMTLAAAFILSACGAIPTLPPLDSTVTVRTPFSPGLPTATGQWHGQLPTETPAESPPAPSETIIATAEPSHTPLPPTNTPSYSPTAAKTATSAPSLTPTATKSPTATPTATPLPYSPQIMNPYYLANFTHPDLGCGWMGVAGQIFNSAGVVQKDILVKAGGVLNGSPVVEGMTMPLSDPEVDLAYGPGGYELTLADGPAASESTLWVQLFSLDSKPLSERIYLVTYDDCQKNLIVLNFIEE